MKKSPRALAAAFGLWGAGCGTYLPPPSQAVVAPTCSAIDCPPQAPRVFDEPSSLIAGGLAGADSVALSFSGDGGVRVVYRDRGKGAVQYATLSRSGSWILQGVAPGQGPALALDEGGFPRVAYADPQGGRVGLASFGVAGWQSSYLPVAGTVVSAIALALDSGGGAHLAFFEEKTGANGPTVRLEYVTWGGSVEEVADLGLPLSSAWPYGPPGISLAIQIGSGNPVVAFTGTSGVGAAVRAGGGWTLEAPDPAFPNGGYDISTAADREGGIHLVHAAPFSIGLRYCRRSTAPSWSCDSVDTGLGAGGTGTSLVLDPSGAPFVAYGNSEASQLWVGTRRSFGWSLREVIERQGVLSSPSIAFHPAGFPLVGYTVLSLGSDGNLVGEVSVARVESYPFP